MLTFRFTGGKGEMIEPEVLVSGMVGKQIRFVFSEEWEGLRKEAVYRAGQVSCISEDIGEVDIIPEPVLTKALRRLYVGVCGKDETGQVVIPTMFVPGPFIHIGATDTPDVDPEDPEWMDFKQALEETIRFTPQELTADQQAQARANIGVSDGLWNTAAGELLMALLRKAVFTQEVSGEILALEKLLALEAPPEEPEIPEEPETVCYYVSCGLEHVTAQPASELVEQGQSCTIVLTVEEGYVLDTVTVTMGGADITASALVEGGVSIPGVTGDVVITAKAVVPGKTYLAASVYTIGGVPMLNFQNEANTDRMCLLTTEITAETPFPVNGDVILKKWYPVPVPETAGILEITCPGYIGGPQFFTFGEGAYTKTWDAGWQTADSCTLEFTPGAHEFVLINFKKTDGSRFALEDADLSGFGIQFREPEVSGPEMFPVTMSFTHVSAANNQRTVEEGSNYINVLLPDDDWELFSVKVTMGGQDVTDAVLDGKKINIPQVTGALFITAVAVEVQKDPVQYLSGSVYTNGGVAMVNILNSASTNRFCCVATEVTADTPFPVNGTSPIGDLYLLAVPETAATLKVTSPGYIGGPQFFTLADGAYTRTIDAGWQTVDSFTYAITPGANQFVILNFKKPDNSNFSFDSVDTSGFAIEFE